MNCDWIVTVSDKAARSLRGGHPWVYEGEILETQGASADGALAEVRSKSGRWLGVGFYNSHSKIRVRLLTRNPNGMRRSPCF